jgi:hypothetical protein
MTMVVLYRWSRPVPRMSLALRASHHMRPAAGWNCVTDKKGKAGERELTCQTSKDEVEDECRDDVYPCLESSTSRTFE